MINFWRLLEELAMFEKASLVGPGSVKDHLERVSMLLGSHVDDIYLPSNRNPGLQTIVLVFEGREPVQ